MDGGGANGGEMVSDDPFGPNWALLPDGQGGYDVFDVRGEFDIFLFMIVN
jgi:hypothetical protein